MVMFYGGCVAYLEDLMCGLCMHLLGHFTIFEHILGGCTCGDLSCILGDIYFLLFHGVLAPLKP